MAGDRAAGGGDRVVAVRRAQGGQAERARGQRGDHADDRAMSGTAPLASRASHAPSMRRDLLSAYLATGAKVGSWAVVSAVVYRYLGAGEFAILALIRGTIGLLNY